MPDHVASSHIDDCQLMIINGMTLRKNRGTFCVSKGEWIIPCSQDITMKQKVPFTYPQQQNISLPTEFLPESPFEIPGQLKEEHFRLYYLTIIFRV